MAGVDGDSPFDWWSVSAPDGCGNGFTQLVDALACSGGDVEPWTLRRGGHGGLEILLGGNENQGGRNRCSGEASLGDGLVLSGVALLAVEEVEQDASASGCFDRTAHTLLFDVVVRGAQAGSVRQFARRAAYGDPLLHGIAGGARGGGDNGAILSTEGVKKAGFASIRSTDDGDVDALSQYLAALSRSEQGADVIRCLGELCSDTGRGIRGDVFVGKINVSFDMCQHGDEGLAELGNFFAQPSTHSGESSREREVGLGCDQVHDTFGLGQVHLAIQKSSLGELACFRESGAGGAGSGEYFFYDGGIAVAGDLEHVFAREGAGAMEGCDESGVPGAAAEVELGECGAAGDQWSSMSGSQLLPDGEGGWTADPNQG